MLDSGAAELGMSINCTSVELALIVSGGHTVLFGISGAHVYFVDCEIERGKRGGIFGTVVKRGISKRIELGMGKAVPKHDVINSSINVNYAFVVRACNTVNHRGINTNNVNLVVVVGVVVCKSGAASERR